MGIEPALFATVVTAIVLLLALAVGCVVTALTSIWEEHDDE